MKKINTQNKLTNHLMSHGKKKTSEKILLKSFKNLQKKLKNEPLKIVKLALIYSTPIFKLHRIKNKKVKKRTGNIREIPSFISNKKSRISLAIKFILANLKNKKEHKTYKKLKNEIILNASNKNNTILLKNELQKNVLTKKHYFLYYRWH